MHPSGNAGGMGGLAGMDVGVDDLAELDNFLDSYLAQLQSSDQQQRGALQQQQQQQQAQAQQQAVLQQQEAALRAQQGMANFPLHGGSLQGGAGQGAGLMGQLAQGGFGAQGLGLGGLQGGAGGLGMQPGGGLGMGGLGMGGLGMGLQGGGGMAGLLGMGMGGMGAGSLGAGMPGGLGGMPASSQLGLDGLLASKMGVAAGQQGFARPTAITTAIAAAEASKAAKSAAGGGAKGGAAAAAAGGGGGAQRRGRSGTRAPRKSEPEPVSSGDEYDSSGGSASSEDEHKSKKKATGAGRDGPVDEAERRHLAIQEKNRKAQRRFRERQKNKLAELHKQIEELTGKVSNLQTENAALHSRTSILEKVLDMRNEQIQVMQENKETPEAELAGLAGGGPASGASNLVPLTPEAMKELTSEEIYKIYQTYVKELSVKLVDVNRLDQDGAGQPDAGGEVALAASELERLVRDLSVMIMRLGVAKPLETRKFIVFSRQYLGNTEKEVIELWKNVMRSIELSAGQMREIVELKRMFLQKIEPIMDERKHLNVSIQSNLPHDTFHTKNSISYIKAHEAVSKLRDNLRAEQHVVLEFAVAVFRGVFKPRQMATLLVKCYPAVPDALGIASALASELGEPDTPATHQLAMQLGGYSVPTGQNSNLTLNANYFHIHPSLMPMGGGSTDSNQPLPPAAGPGAAGGMGALVPPTLSMGGQGGGLQGGGMGGVAPSGGSNNSQQQMMMAMLMGGGGAGAGMGGGGGSAAGAPGVMTSAALMHAAATMGPHTRLPGGGSGGGGTTGGFMGGMASMPGAAQPPLDPLNMLAEMRARSGSTTASSAGGNAQALSSHSGGSGV